MNLTQGNDFILIGTSSLAINCYKELLNNFFNNIYIVPLDDTFEEWAYKNIDHSKIMTLDFFLKDNTSAFYLFSISNPKILGLKTLNRFRYAINFHNGVLPYYAGLNAPIWSLLNKEKYHGVTWHLMDEGIDSGEIILEKKIIIQEDDNSASLFAKSYSEGFILFKKLLGDILGFVDKSYPQSRTGRIYHSALDLPKNSGLIICRDDCIEYYKYLVRGLFFEGYGNLVTTPKLVIKERLYFIGKCLFNNSNKRISTGEITLINQNNLKISIDGYDMNIVRLYDSSFNIITNYTGIGISLGDNISINKDELFKANNDISQAKKNDALWVSLLNKITLREKATKKTLKTHSIISISENNWNSFIDYVTKLLANDKVLNINKCWLRNSDSIYHFPYIPILSEFNLDLASKVMSADLGLRFPKYSVSDKLLSFSLGFLFSDKSEDRHKSKVVFLRKNDRHIDVIINDSDKHILDSIRKLLKIKFNIINEQYDFYKISNYELIKYNRKPKYSYNNLDHVFNLVKISATKFYNKEAVVCGSDSLNYKEVLSVSNNISQNLINNGVSYGDSVVVLCNRSVFQPSIILGLISIGAIYVPLNIDDPVDRIKKQSELCGASFLITNLYDIDSFVFRGISKLSLKDLLSENVIVNCPNISSSTAYIIFTSGSTGEPKGVPITMSSLSIVLRDMVHLLGISSSDVIFSISKFSFDLSIFDLLVPLLCGGKVVILEENKLLQPFEWYKNIIEHRVTIWNSVPSIFGLMFDTIDESKLSQTSIRLAILSGEKIDSKLAKKSLYAGFDTYSFGGATEATIWSIYYKITKNNINDYAFIPYGYPLANQKIYILDENLNLSSIDSEGEIYIGGDCLSLGYLNLNLNKDTFITHDVYGKLYKTGDRGYFKRDKTGLLVFILGRNDSQIKRNGNRVELREIDEVIKDKCGVDFAYTVFDADNDYIHTAILKESGLDLHGIINLSETFLPAYMVPDHIFEINKVPLTKNGKIDTKTILTNATSVLNKSKINTVSASAQSNTLKIVTNIWSNLLDKKCDSETNFFQCGGNSLKSIKLVKQIQDKLSIKTLFNFVFKYPNLGEYCKEIETIGKRHKDKLSINNTNDVYKLSLSSSQKLMINQCELNNELYIVKATIYNLNPIEDIYGYVRKWKQVCGYLDHFKMKVDHDGMNYSIENTNEIILLEVNEEEFKKNHLIDKIRNSFIPRFPIYIIYNRLNAKVIRVYFHHVLMDSFDFKNLCDLISKPSILEKYDFNAQNSFYKKNISLRNYNNKDMSYWKSRFKGIMDYSYKPDFGTRDGKYKKYRCSINISDIQRQLYGLSVTSSSIISFIWGLSLCQFNNTDRSVFSIATRDINIQDDLIGMFMTVIPIPFKTNPEDKIRDQIDKFSNSLFDDINESANTNVLEIIRSIEIDNFEQLSNILVFNDYNKSDTYKLDFVDYTEFDLINYVSINGGHIVMESTHQNNDLKVRKFFEVFVDVFEIIQSNMMLNFTETTKNSIQKYVYNEYDNFFEKSHQNLLKKNTEVVVDQDGHYTYSHILTEANLIADRIYDINNLDVVVIFVAKSVKLVSSIISTMIIKKPFLLLDQNAPELYVEMIADKFKNILILHDKPIHKRWSTISTKLIDLNDITDCTTEHILSPVLCEYYVFTSGTTSKPDIIHINPIQSNAFFGAFYDKHHQEFSDVLNLNILSITPQSFDIFILEVLFIFVLDCKVFLFENNLCSTEQLNKTIDDNAINFIQTTPSIYEIFLANNIEVKYIFLGGEELKGHLAENILSKNQILYNMYGPTETTIWTSSKRVRGITNQISVGVPFKSTKYYLISKLGLPQSEGIDGELLIYGSQVSFDALDNKNKFFEFGYKNIAYKTGDIFRKIGDEYYFQGRLDREIKNKGVRISPIQVETLISNIEGIKDSVVYLEKDELKVCFTSNNMSSEISISCAVFSDLEQSIIRDYKSLLRLSKQAEFRNLDSIWIPERHFGSVGGLFSSPFIIASYILSNTNKIKVKIGSVVLPLHHPTVISESISTLREMYPGRFGVSFASGWSKDDFIINPTAYEKRYEIFESKLDNVLGHMLGHTVRYSNYMNKDVEIETYPKTSTLENNIMLSESIAQRHEQFIVAAKKGLGVYTHLLMQNLDQLSEKLYAYRINFNEDKVCGNKRVSLLIHSSLVTEESDLEVAKYSLKNYFISHKNLLDKSIEEISDFSLFDDYLDDYIEEFIANRSLIGNKEFIRNKLKLLFSSGVDEVVMLVDFLNDQKILSSTIDSIPKIIDEYDFSVSRYDDTLFKSINNVLVKSLPHNMIPDKLMLVNKFPINRNGKLDLKSFPSQHIPKEASPKISYTDGIDKCISEFIYEIVGSYIGLNISFFNSGLHSINIPKIIRNINSRFETNLIIRDMYKYNTIQKLSEHIRSSKKPSKYASGSIEYKRVKLSIYQESILYLSLDKKLARIYNDNFILKLSKEINVENFLFSIESIFNKYPILNSKLLYVDKGYFIEYITEQIKVIRIMSKNPILKMKTIGNNIFSEGDRLLNIYYIHNNTCDYVLFNFHHIINDGTSFNLLIKNSYNFYKYKKTATNELLTYQDYVNRVDGSDNKSKQIYRPHIKYFGKYVKSYHGEKRIVLNDLKLTNSILNFAQSSNVSIFSCLSYIFICKLRRLIPEMSFSFGFPINNRDKETVNTIGMFTSLGYINIHSHVNVFDIEYQYQRISEDKIAYHNVYFNYDDINKSLRKISLVIGGFETLSIPENEVRIEYVDYGISRYDIEIQYTLVRNQFSFIVILSKGLSDEFKIFFSKLDTDDLTNLINDCKEDYGGWESIFNEIYNKSKDKYAGWVSHDGAIISEKIMDVWIKSKFRSINKYKPTNVFEIGCGSGIFAEYCLQKKANYTGCDISYYTISNLRKKYQDYDFLYCDAIQSVSLIPKNTDIIIINSVIQYFDSLDYLKDLCKLIYKKFKDKGIVVFFGDIIYPTLMPYLQGELTVDPQIIKSCFGESFCYSVMNLEPELTKDFYGRYNFIIEMGNNTRNYNLLEIKSIDDLIDGDILFFIKISEKDDSRLRVITDFCSNQSGQWSFSTFYDLNNPMVILLYIFKTNLFPNIEFNANKQTYSKKQSLFLDVVKSNIGSNIALHSSFNYHGGRSILAMKLSSDLQRLNINITANMLLKSDSLYEILNSVDSFLKDVESKDNYNAILLSSPQQRHILNNNTRLSYWNQSYLFKIKLKIDIPLLMKNVYNLLNSSDTFRFRLISDGSLIKSVDSDSISISCKSIGSINAMYKHCNSEQEKISINDGYNSVVTIYELLDDKYISVIINNLLFDGLSWINFISALTEVTQSNNNNQVNRDFYSWNTKKINSEEKVSDFDYKYWSKIHMDMPVNNFKSVVGRNKMHRFKIYFDKYISDIDCQALTLSSYAYALMQLKHTKKTFIGIENHGRGHGESVCEINAFGWFTQITPLKIVYSDDPFKLYSKCKESLDNVPNSKFSYSYLYEREIQSGLVSPYRFNYFGDIMEYLDSELFSLCDPWKITNRSDKAMLVDYMTHIDVFLLDKNSGIEVILKCNLDSDIEIGALITKLKLHINTLISQLNRGINK